MKKYMVESFVVCNDGRESHDVYECESIERAKDWTGECIRLADVNTLKISKTGKEQRKQLSRGKYVTIERMNHWKSVAVYVWENGTDNVIEKWESREA